LFSPLFPSNRQLRCTRPSPLLRPVGARPSRVSNPPPTTRGHDFSLTILRRDGRPARLQRLVRRPLQGRIRGGASVRGWRCADPRLFSSRPFRLEEPPARQHLASYAARSGARSGRLMSGKPSSFRTRVTAATVTLLGAVISMPIGFPRWVKSMTSLPCDLRRSAAPVPRCARQVKVRRDRTAMTVGDLQARLLHLIHRRWDRPSRQPAPVGRRAFAGATHV